MYIEHFTATRSAIQAYGRPHAVTTFWIMYYFIINLYVSSDNRNAMLCMCIVHCGSHYASIIIACDEFIGKVENILSF